MAELVIYGSPVSPFVRKALAVCAEKNLDFELGQVNVFDPPDWFREISPMVRIPVLRDNTIATEGPNGTIADSSAICAYVERKHPENALYPKDAFQYGRALWIEEYADSLLAATGGGGIFRAIFFSLMQGKDPDLDTARETWTEKMPPILEYLDEALGDGEFYAGDVDFHSRHNSGLLPDAGRARRQARSWQISRSGSTLCAHGRASFDCAALRAS